MPIPNLFKGLLVLEIIVFILVGFAIGFGWAILLILISMLIGFLLIKRQGVAMMMQMQRSPQSSAAQMQQMMDSSVWLLSGILFIIPGFITSLIGLMCLIPNLERKLLNKLGSSKNKPANDSQHQATIIEGESWKNED